MKAASVEEQQGELHLVFLGHSRKAHLFERLCAGVSKWEKHAAYEDTHYLTVQLPEGDSSRDVVVEMADPGLGKTGGREMAIRGADMALLFCSEQNASSLERLFELPAIFALRKHPCPVLLFCDTDDTDCEDAASGVESVSEGYESDPERSEGLQRRPSMEKMRRSQENGERPDARRAEELAALLGPQCRLVRTSLHELADPVQLLRELVQESLKKGRAGRRRKVFGKSAGSKSREETPKEDSSSSSTEREKKKRNPQNSKICVLM